MNKKISTFSLLQLLEKKKEDHFFIELKKAKNDLKKAHHQLKQLQNYYDEYLFALKKHSIQGIKISHYQSYYQFFEPLERAINEQKKRCDEQKTNEERIKEAWKNHYKKKNIFKNLTQKFEEQKKMNRQRIDRISMDEVAEQMRLRHR
jgi:flagellar export protein FliJ